jgi:hypothetical protein
LKRGKTKKRNTPSKKNEEKLMLRQTLGLFLCLLLFLNGFSMASATPATSHKPSITQTSSHVIDNISYIAQTERNYCHYSCLAMVLNFMGLNTSLDELLFFGGVGYAHTYRDSTRLPEPFIYQAYYLDLFGVTEHMWYAQIPEPYSNENWTQYWTKTQENISNNKPVLTNADPYSLPSLRNQFAVDNQTWTTLFPPSIHVILITGYDSTNQTVCYQDPNAGYYGSSHFGDHAWMTTSQFRTAVENCIIHQYRIGTFTQTTPPMPREEAASLALQRNLEFLNGIDNPLYGLNATQKLCNWYSPQNMTATIALYEQQGGPSHTVLLTRFAHLACSMLRPIKPNVFDIISQAPHDPFKETAAGKNHAADYLMKNQDLTWATNQSQLLRDEAASWTILSSQYQVFLRHGPNILNAKAEKTMKTMEKTTQDILSKEQKILDTRL